MAMHDPPHPGGIIRRQCLEPLDLTVTRAAEGLGVTRQALSDECSIPRRVRGPKGPSNANWAPCRLPQSRERGIPVDTREGRRSEMTVPDITGKCSLPHSKVAVWRSMGNARLSARGRRARCSPLESPGRPSGWR